MTAASVLPAPQRPSLLLERWPLVLGLLVLVIPTLVRLGQRFWSTEAGMHGPIVLATGAWLLLKEREAIVAARQPARPWLTALILVPCLLVYVFGRAFDFPWLEAAAVAGILIACFYNEFGLGAVRQEWFPILYLAFLIPIPGWLLDEATAPLKAYISYSATQILAAAGYPIARAGVTLYIAQYELLVEDACSGLNSLVSLTVISLFYIYLQHRASWRYALFLMLWILPMALLANLLRVMLIVLLTYYFGNATAQGWLHPTAGLFLFTTALLGIFAVDKIMTPVRLALTRRGRA